MTGKRRIANRAQRAAGNFGHRWVRDGYRYPADGVEVVVPGHRVYVAPR